MKHLQGFFDFIREKGVVGLAIGIIMGGAVTKLVTALVTDIVNPVIGILLGRVGDLALLSTTIGASEIKWGDFIANIIDFVIIAAVIYFVFKGLRLDRLDKKQDPAS